MAEQTFFLPVGTASTSWQDSMGVHIRVYTTDGYNVTERCCDPNTNWTTGSFAQGGSDISVTSWVDSGGTYHIRIYCNIANVTTEYCNDGNDQWYTGGFSYG